MTLCEDCPRWGHSTDATRCLPCPRRPENRSPGTDLKTGEYSTAQMMIDEFTMGDTSQPLFD